MSSRIDRRRRIGPAVARPWLLFETPSVVNSPTACQNRLPKRNHSKPVPVSRTTDCGPKLASSASTKAACDALVGSKT